jgi:VWFA-related protein
MHAGRIAAAVGLTLAGLGAAASAQDLPRPTFRIASDLVVVDLLATDRGGRFVADLQPSHLTVLQDGKPQKVEFLRLVRGAGRGVIPTSPATPNQPSNGVDSAASSETSAAAAPVSLAVVVDMYSTPPEALSFVKEAITRMVADELPPGSKVTIATLDDGLTVRQGMTPDMNAVRTSVQSLALSGSVAPTLAHILESADAMCETSGSGVDRTPAFHQTMAMAKMVATESQRRLKAAADSLGSLSTSLGSESGRKHIVFYSAGYAINPAHAIIDVVAAANAACAGLDISAMRRRVAEELAPFAEFDASPALRQMVDRANRAQVAFYTVDSRGLVTGGVEARHRGSARIARGAQLQKALQLEATLPQEFLRSAAADTGGRSLLNSNDLAEGMRRAWLDASEYYLIGYVPASTPKKGNFHRIEVKVARPNIDLRYRAGYYEATDKEVATREVESALRTPGAFTHTGLEIAAIVAGRQLRVTALLPPTAVQFTAKDNTHIGEITVHATLHDSNGKLVGGKPLFGKDIGLRFTPAQIDGMRTSDNVEIPVEVDAPKAGTYLLTVVARASGGWIGAKTTSVAVSGQRQPPQ